MYNKNHSLIFQVILMIRITKKLSVFEIEKAKPKEKEFKLMDGDGLFLLVSRNGKKDGGFGTINP